MSRIISHATARRLVLRGYATTTATPATANTSTSFAPGAARTATSVVAAKDKSPTGGPSAGVRVLRPLAIRENRKMGRMILLDHAVIPRGTGFPDHPHRGLTTVTYVLKGEVEHEDFLGSYGLLRPGDAQWMTAGRGIMHAEMPRYTSPSSPETEILQLWVDLPEKDKMVDPSYSQRDAADIDTAHVEGANIRVIAGESHGVVAPVRDHGGCWYLDANLQPGATIIQQLPQGWDAFVYVLDGEVTAGGKTTGPKNAIVLSHQDGEARVEIASTDGARVVIIAAEPLNQNVVFANHGLFSLATEQDAEKAMDDWKHGKNGFEGAHEWRSTIAKELQNRSNNR